MRSFTLAAALSLLAVPAFAQAPATTTTTTTPPAPAMTAPAATTTTTTVPAEMPAGSSKHMAMQQRFDAANTTHDGHLTKEQAEAGNMKGIAKHFDEIDTGKKGYVTIEEIKAYHRAKHAAHKAKKAAE